MAMLYTQLLGGKYQKGRVLISALVVFILCFEENVFRILP